MVESPQGFVGELEELDQTDDEPVAEPFGYVVGVRVEGPVQVHQVPSVSAGSRSFAEVGTASVKVLNADPRRRIAHIISLDENMHYGNSQSEADASTGVVWPELVPLPITHMDEVWARSATATTTISVIVENWAS